MTITESARVAKARRFMSRWELWVGIAYFGLIFVGGYLYNQRGDEQARRLSQARIAATADVTTCFTQLRDGPDTVKLLSLVAFLADSQIKANKAALATTSAPELQRIRHNTISRLEPQRAAARKFRDRIRLAIPTLAECKARARVLGINPRPIREAVNRQR